MSELYSLKNLSRVFGRREVLHLDELTIEAGLIYGLLGPNGSGKTTLMKILAFLDAPSTGQLKFKGNPVEAKAMAPLRAKVVWSPQFPVMFTDTLRYNVEYPMKIRGIESSTRRRRAMELLEMVRLTALADAPARRLSGGEAQRASLARAIAAGAEVLLLDEPTANVDAASRQELVKLVEEIWRERQLSIIITTHDTSLEADLCQKQIKLTDGRLVSVADSKIYDATLTPGEGGLTRLHLPPEAGSLKGLLTVVALDGQTDGLIMLKLATPANQILTARIKDNDSLRLARQLALNAPVST